MGPHHHQQNGLLNRTGFYVTLFLVTLLVLYVRYVALRPSPYMIYFVQAVTITGPQRSMIPPVDLGQPNVIRNTSSSAEFPSGRPDFSQQRFSAKLHMINPIQLFTDYPISHFVSIEMGLIEMEWITANVISCIHPIFGILAGYLVIKSRIGGSSSSSSNSTANNNSASGIPSSTSNGTISPTSVVMQDIPSETPPLSSPVGDSDTIGPTVANRRTRSAANVEELATMERTDSTINIPTDKETAALLSDVSTKQSVQIHTLRLACLAMMVRNTLDTLDGVFARLRKQSRPPGVPPPRLFGFTGEVIDGVTDVTGVLFFALGCATFLFSRSVIVSRIPSSLLSRLGFRTHIVRPLYFSRTVIVFGLLYISFASSIWESFVLKYQSLFDAYANHNAQIFELDSNVHVRIMEICWSLTCGDAIFSVLIALTFFNRLWEGIQFYFFIGYPWLLLVTIYSFWVWNSVILTNPVAASIIAQNPNLF